MSPGSPCNKSLRKASGFFFMWWLCRKEAFASYLLDLITQAMAERTRNDLSFLKLNGKFIFSFSVSFFFVQECNATVENGWRLLFRFTRTGLMKHGTHACQSVTSLNPADTRSKECNVQKPIHGNTQGEIAKCTSRELYFPQSYLMCQSTVPKKMATVTFTHSS